MIQLSQLTRDALIRKYRACQHLQQIDWTPQVAAEMSRIEREADRRRMTLPA